MRKTRYLSLVVLAVSFASAAFAQSVTAATQTPPVSLASLTTARSQFVAYYTAAGADANNARMQPALSGLSSQAISLTATNYLLPNGSWSDIDYSPANVNWPAWNHSRRLLILAKAYTTAGQPLYHDPQLLLRIESVISFMQTYYSTTSPAPANWWFFPIGVPIDLGPSLVLLRNSIRADVFAAALQTLDAHVGPSVTTTTDGMAMTGQNLVWSAFAHMCVALLKDDTAMMQQVRDAMASETVPITGAEGMQVDWSFQQHGPQLYTGGYGASFGYEVSKYQLITRGTDAALPQSSADAFANYTADGITWSLYRNYFDVSVISREVVRASSTGFNGLATLAQMAKVPSSRSTDIGHAAATMLQSWQWTLPTEIAALAAAAESSSYNVVPASGHRTFYQSDYAVHRRSGWFASIKMVSTRTKSGEKTSGENLLGSRQSDGRFYLVLSGDEYFGRRAWPVLDWSRLSGITVEQKPGVASSNYGYGMKSFVGGADDGRNGVAAMDFGPSIDSLLTAKKSWFFFDDAIVFLSNSISCPTANHAETIVHQWPLSRLDAPLVVDGIQKPATDGWNESLRAVKWAAADGIGYYFFAGANVEAKRELRSGSWSTIGGSASDGDVTDPILTLWLDHGPYISGATAAYAIVPNVTQDQMRLWAQQNPISVVINSDQASAVRNNRDGAIGITFWKATKVEGYISDMPAVAYVTRNGDVTQISIADPAQGTGLMHFTVPGRQLFVSSDVKVTLTQTTDGTRIELPRNAGKSLHITVQKYRRHHAARRAGTTATSVSPHLSD